MNVERLVKRGVIVIAWVMAGSSALSLLIVLPAALLLRNRAVLLEALAVDVPIIAALGAFSLWATDRWWIHEGTYRYLDWPAWAKRYRWRILAGGLVWAITLMGLLVVSRAG